MLCGRGDDHPLIAFLTTMRVTSCSCHFVFCCNGETLQTGRSAARLNNGCLIRGQHLGVMQYLKIKAVFEDKEKDNKIKCNRKLHKKFDALFDHFVKMSLEILKNPKKCMECVQILL